MKRILDLQCKSCRMVVRRWIEETDLDKEQCPNCAKKEMVAREPEYPKASACSCAPRVRFS